jgi:hypothetical protein
MIIILVFLERKDDPGQEDETVFPATQKHMGLLPRSASLFTVLFACHIVLMRLSSVVHTPMKTDHVVILLSVPNEL